MILASTSGELHGVDISRPMVQRASRRFRRHGRLHLHRASAEALPLPDAAVDKACSVNNIYFWGDPAAGMAEFARVIRPGGRQLGRASCRERVCQAVEISVVSVSIQKKS